MLRIALRLALISIVGLWGLLLLPRLVPMRENPAVAAFLSADDCAAPCVLGLEVGRTYRNQAITLLEQHPWIDADDVDAAYLNAIRWDWNGTQPGFLQRESTIYLRSGVVDRVEIRALVPMYWLRLHLGGPSQTAFSAYRVPGGYRFGTLLDVYPAHSLAVSSGTQCAAALLDTLAAPVTLLWYTPHPDLNPGERFLRISLDPC